MNYKQFITMLINQGYDFFVSPQEGKVVIELSFKASYFSDIIPPQELPLHHEAIVRIDQDELYVVFIWTFSSIIKDQKTA